MAIGIAILAVTSLLIITTPPLVPHFRFARSTVSQGVELSLNEQPYESGKFLVTAEDPSKKAEVRPRTMKFEKSGRLSHESGGGRWPHRGPA